MSGDRALDRGTSPLGRPRPKAEITKYDLVTEYVIYDTSVDRLHVLNETARAIFLLCDGSRTADEIAAALLETYDLDPAAAQRDVRIVIEDLVRIGLMIPG